MKIAYLTGEYPKVSHTFIQREVAALRAQGVDVRAFSIRHPPQDTVVGDEQRAEAMGTTYVLDLAKSPWRLISSHLLMFFRSPGHWLAALTLAWRTRSPGLRAALWQLFYFGEAGVLARSLRDNGIGHLHNHFADSSCSVAMLASTMSGIPFSFTIHGPTEFFEAKRWYLGEKVARARFVSCISNFARSQMMLFSSEAHWFKLKIVHCGIDASLYGRAPGPYKKRILFIGRLTEVKGAPLLLDAIAALRAVHSELRLKVIGDGPARDTLEAQAKRIGISDLVDFVGYQPQDAVAASLRESDILALPSFAEGLPVVLMEAMASYLPVVTTQIAGIPELVGHAQNGFLVPPGDTDSLIAHLDLLLSDPTLCARMGRDGRVAVEQNFDSRREATKLAELFLGAGS